MKLSKSVPMALAAFLVLGATAQAYPRVKFRGPGGQTLEVSKFRQTPGGRRLFGMNGQPGMATAMVERMGLAAMPSGIRTLEVWVLEDSAAQPSEGAAVFQGDDGAPARRIEIGNHAMAALPTATALRDELVRLAAYLGEPGDEPGCGMHLVGNGNTDIEDSRYFGIAFHEGYAAYQVAHASAAMRRRLARPVATVDGDRPAAELSFGELLQVPAVTAGILLDISGELPDGQRDVRRAMTALEPDSCHYVGQVLENYLELSGNERHRKALEAIVARRTLGRGSDWDIELVLRGVKPDFERDGGAAWPPADATEQVVAPFLPTPRLPTERKVETGSDLLGL